MTMRLGLIGLSEGNGHPYSWSAICNGYDPSRMAFCGFPVIPDYLAQQHWPDARLPGVEVTHVWTQDEALSRRIADASLIREVVDEPSRMLGQVDALLLARDDAEHHFTFAAPFLRAGVPVYVDKPVAVSMQALRALYEAQRFEGQLFTCSALRYAREMMLDGAARGRIGRIRHVQAVTPGKWASYAVHVIEPLLGIVGDAAAHGGRIRPRAIGEAGRALSIEFDSGISADVAALGKGVSAPLSIRVHGEQGWQDLVFSDAFTAFRSALADFAEGVRTRTCRSPRTFNEKVVGIIEAGMQA